MTRMIIKIQRSLATTEKEQQMLVYDQSREFEYEGPITVEVAALLGREPKGYFIAEFDDASGMLDIIAEVDVDPEW